MALPTMLFVRHAMGPTGGHIQVCNYMHHVRASGLFEPVLHMTKKSTPGALAPWLPKNIRRVPVDFEPDVFFLGGTDWSVLDRAGVSTGAKPVVNLLQGLRHARPNDPRSKFLDRPALRICVSPEVAAAVTATGQASGPIVTVPLGLNMGELAKLRADEQEQRVFIGGMKRPKIAQEVAKVLEAKGVAVHLQVKRVERPVFLQHIARSAVSVLLPVDDEGFFMPALEAMAMGSAAVVPDAGGNRSFCLDGETCLMPPYTVAGLAKAALRLWENPDLRGTLNRGGFAMAERHRLKQERSAFLEALERYLGRGASQ